MQLSNYKRMQEYKCLNQFIRLQQFSIQMNSKNPADNLQNEKSIFPHLLCQKALPSSYVTPKRTTHQRELPMDDQQKRIYQQPFHSEQSQRKMTFKSMKSQEKRQMVEEKNQQYFIMNFEKLLNLNKSQQDLDLLSYKLLHLLSPKKNNQLQRISIEKLLRMFQQDQQPSHSCKAGLSPQESKDCGHLNAKDQLINLINHFQVYSKSLIDVMKFNDFQTSQSCSSQIFSQKLCFLEEKTKEMEYAFCSELRDFKLSTCKEEKTRHKAKGKTGKRAEKKKAEKQKRVDEIPHGVCKQLFEAIDQELPNNEMDQE